MKVLWTPATKAAGVEFGAEDLVGAVSQDGNAPVADEGDELPVVRGLDLRAETLRFMQNGLCFHVDQNQVPWFGAELFKALSKAGRGFDHVAGDAQNLIPDGAQNLSLAKVQNGFLWWCLAYADH